ncbi:hypothetical protein NW762_013442 [Fusarium torreyae]|uniref:Zn(2)-C6 fungal-type domain-containing protein n=1 Tax=Fusarium torreyae TaxID=1237075 RepID=A0A9W8RKD7_9HYPO|nr:hypothetical protein NW762_013442 [Fusarium torreyae]
MSHRRCIRACARCRDMKVRCSGTIPCVRCQRGKRECYFRPEDLRTTVPSSYLESLEAQVYGDGRPVNRDHAQRPPSRDSTTQPGSIPGTRAGAEGSEGRSSITQEHVDEAEAATNQAADDENDNEVNSPEFKRNPLVDSGEVYAQDPGGKFWYMGPTSSWAFCRRVLALIGNSTPNPEPPVYPWDLETIDLNWIPIGLHEQPDVSGLPSQEYALYLLSTVQYHLGSLCEIIDQESFQRSVELFYADPAVVAKRSRYWFSQFLFVLAFGEAFLNSSSSKGIPGTRFASRALSLIPSLIPMDGNKDTLSAVQAHCLAALYLQAVDLRLMAYQIIGQGLRISVIEGWHRYMPPENVGKEHSKRCNTIFWITYTIDQEFGPLVGAPSSIRPEDITARLPSEIDSSHRGLALTLQVRMSRLTATILTGGEASYD